MRTILGRLAEDADLIVVDSPPASGGDGRCSSPRSPTARSTSIEAGRTRRGAVRRGREALAQSVRRVLGVALNRLPSRPVGGYYYYDYYGAYGAASEPVKPGACTRPRRRSRTRGLMAEPGGERGS